jgi:hypothetical protein
VLLQQPTSPRRAWWPRRGKRFGHYCMGSCWRTEAAAPSWKSGFGPLAIRPAMRVRWFLLGYSSGALAHAPPFRIRSSPSTGAVWSARAWSTGRPGQGGLHHWGGSLLAELLRRNLKHAGVVSRSSKRWADSPRPAGRLRRLARNHRTRSQEPRPETSGRTACFLFGGLGLR